MRTGFYKLSIALIAGTTIGVGAAAFFSAKIEAARPPDIPGFLWPDPKVLQDFTLTDQRSAPFDIERIEGRWSFLLFGYTHCPDVCPTTLAMLAEVSHELGADGVAGDGVQFVFVSVDPARDTPARLGEYITYFDPDFLAVTGPDNALDPLTRQLGIFVSRDAPDDTGNYLVGHGAAVLLIDPRARLVGVYQAPHDPAAIARSFRRIREFLEG